jgi:hypothetical protein
MAWSIGSRLSPMSGCSSGSAALVPCNRCRRQETVQESKITAQDVKAGVEHWREGSRNASPRGLKLRTVGTVGIGSPTADLRLEMSGRFGVQQALR